MRHQTRSAHLLGSGLRRLGAALARAYAKPGVLLTLPQTTPAPRHVRILKINHAVFLKEVKPGDDLLANVVESDEFTAVCAGQIIKGEAICAFAIVEVYFVEA